MNRAIIYKALYVLVHWAFTIFEQVSGTLDYVTNKIVGFCHEFLFISERNSYLPKRITRIRKIPAHLTVILGSEQPSYKDLANLVIWCLATRINFISFYDHKGLLKKNEDELQYEISKRKLKEDHVIWHKGSESTYKNGFIGRKVHVKIVSEEDGKDSVVNLTKKLSQTKNINFNIEDISEQLQKQYEFPEPDLGFVCGKTFSLYNYPPWQIRVTEFLSIGSHRDITFSFFLNMLDQYGKCEQRWGK
ncbi:hypothetical protein NQ317_019763 [Molorchus minor]|uniref:ditrans,polycis-polyprenyl diphosphate synthase [(2E,6E)-farnesyldiphosphate specific] n=1 Tax=Molorchus minor TaxID=1323400 RepID=A0ABQ9K4J6_9CUCU|nr:hypothetical protein NQ317_019763 [Molorchus minor]